MIGLGTFACERFPDRMSGLNFLRIFTLRRRNADLFELATGTC
jgi:hypothetical protein